MDQSLLPYDLWVEQALRDVIQKALTVAATDGLPGEHHFYVTFETAAEGVEMPDYLRAQYAKEMTIVLQHRFWDLKVEDEGFSVTLTFNGVAERLSMPYDAVVAFADPSVKFGLQIKAAEEAQEANEGDLRLVPEEAEGAEPEAAAEAAGDEEEPADEKKPGEIITLDAFRKK